MGLRCLPSRKTQSDKDMEQGPWSLGSRQPQRVRILVADRRKGNESLQRGLSHMGLDGRLGNNHVTPRLRGALRD